jgi:hypothetical protein
LQQKENDWTALVATLGHDLQQGAAPARLPELAAALSSQEALRLGLALAAVGAMAPLWRWLPLVQAVRTAHQPAVVMLRVAMLATTVAAAGSSRRALEALMPSLQVGLVSCQPAEYALLRVAIGEVFQVCAKATGQLLAP